MGEGPIIVVGTGPEIDRAATDLMRAGARTLVVGPDQLTSDLAAGAECLIGIGEAAASLRSRFPHLPLVTLVDEPGPILPVEEAPNATISLGEVSTPSLRLAIGWAQALACAAQREAGFRRVLTVVASTNRAVMQADGPAAFMQEACRIAVGVGGFKLAWIGSAAAGAEELRSVAAAGTGRDYVDAVRIPLGPDAPVGPSLTALRTGTPASCSDILTDPRMSTWRALAIEHGLRSSVALPIPSDDGTLRTLNVYAEVPNAFDDEVVDLLSQLAEDIGAGVSVLDERHRRHRAQGLLADTTEVLGRIAGGAPLEDSVAAVDAMVARHHAGAACHVLRPSADGQHFLPAGAPMHPSLASLPSPGVAPDQAPPWARALTAETRVLVRRDDGVAGTPLTDALASAGVALLHAVPVHATGGGSVAVVVLTAADPDWDFAEDLVAAATRLVGTAVGAADATERLSRDAITDPLTGLGNRTLFFDRVRHRIEQARPAAVLIVDLDRFRLINESFGAEVGRRVLVTVADRLGPGLRPGDTLARVGGDEFGVLFLDPGPPAEVAAIAQHLTEQLAEPLDIEGGWVSVTGSAGIAYAPPAATAEEVLTNAEVAMYRAKRLGGDRVELFDDELRHQAGWWMAVQTALHQSLHAAEERLGDGRAAHTGADGAASAEPGEPALTVLYQPEFRISDGRLIGAEALSRLHVAALGEVPPERFVVVAAAAPALAASLFAVVVDDACRQVSRWRQHQPEAWVAVNVTASQLVDGRLIPTASHALERHGLDATALCLEVSEADVMRDVERSLATLQELDDLGIQIAIDDFGTGYSSLGYAKRLPVRWLKIDREFVAGLGIDPVDSAIVNAAVAMGRALGLTVTAEGVQTATQLEALAAVGCDIAQGFLLGRPMPAASIAELFSGAAVADPAGPEPAP